MGTTDPSPEEVSGSGERARTLSETGGFMKVLVDAGTKKILGAAILGVVLNQASEDTQGYDYYRAVPSKTKTQQPTINTPS